MNENKVGIGRGQTFNPPQTLGSITKSPVFIAIDFISNYGNKGEKATLEQIQTCQEITAEEERQAIIRLADTVKLRVNETKSPL